MLDTDNIRLDIETKLGSTRIDHTLIRNFLFDAIHGSSHSRNSKKEEFVAESLIDRLSHMSDEDLVRTVEDLELGTWQLEDFEKAIRGKYSRSVWTPFE